MFGARNGWRPMAGSREGRDGYEEQYPDQQTKVKEQDDDVKFEITALAVSPSHKRLGLGGCVLSEIECVVIHFTPAGTPYIAGNAVVTPMANGPPF